MLGISYGGISQLFVAATDPPHLAAIAPLSVIDNTATTLYPGGILNTGFALPYAKARDHDAEAAAPGRGEAWALARIRGGDRVCAANQALHPEAVNDVAQVFANRYYVPSVANPLNPTTFVHKIRVPVYLACQWTDEQTGGHCPDLAEHFTGTRLKWFTFTNGAHIDSLDPATARALVRLPVAVRGAPVARAVAERARAGAASSTRWRWGSAGSRSRPTIRSRTGPTTPRRWPRSSSSRRSGSCSTTAPAGRRPGAPGAAFEQSFARLPLPGTQAVSWYLGFGGTLVAGRHPAGPRRHVHLGSGREAADRLQREHRTGRPVGDVAELPLDQGARGTALSYVTRPAQLRMSSWWERDRSRRGSGPRRATWTSR